MAEGAIGRVVGVHGFRVRVELDADQRSPVRADLDGARTVVAINAYLTFAIGAGEDALGVITDLDARETFDQGLEELTLEFVRPRRVVTAQLLGTIQAAPADSYEFRPGITILPTLDTPALPAKEQVHSAVFGTAPKRNRPTGYGEDDFDKGLKLGSPTGVPYQSAFGSYNDLLSRPLAVVGNTGSGKSCSIAHLIQEATRDHSEGNPRFYLLDINGEYGSAFGIEPPAQGRQPNVLYVNGREFTVPLWLMNAADVCQWLSAAEQVQEPTLKNLWSMAKGRSAASGDPARLRATQEAIIRLENLNEILRGSNPYKGQNAFGQFGALKSYLNEIEAGAEIEQRTTRIEELLSPHRASRSTFIGEDEAAISQQIVELSSLLQELVSLEEFEIEESADKPTPFALAEVRDPAALVEAAKSDSGEATFRQNLRGLQLRLANRMEDKRWNCFINFERLGIDSLAKWLDRLGQRATGGPKVSVIDCSMLADEVLPFATGVIGRTLLELREHADSTLRFHEPWVVILEEAHNYIRPSRHDEQRGVRVSRSAFERIAKEGRKFGLSMIVASQRPSEISGTVLSQCANFIMHRLQNPDDIEHFRRIVPSQSRRLLDQATILSSGEAVVLGSAFHIPSRVQIDLPKPEPTSRTAAPFLAWRRGASESFDRDSALRNWGLASQEEDEEELF